MHQRPRNSSNCAFDGFYNAQLFDLSGDQSERWPIGYTAGFALSVSAVLWTVAIMGVTHLL
jgi:hypothetical protein